MPSVDERARDRIAKNEALFRDVNERVKEVDRSQNSSTAETWDFLCECGNSTCLERVSLTVDEYEQVRSDPTLFVIVPGHERPEVEAVIQKHDAYYVIEKRPGEEAIARATDPRA